MLHAPTHTVKIRQNYFELEVTQSMKPYRLKQLEMSTYSNQNN